MVIVEVFETYKNWTALSAPTFRLYTLTILGISKGLLEEIEEQMNVQRENFVCS